MLLIEEKIDEEVRSLDNCDYNSNMFSDILGRIQKDVDDLNLHAYSNLPQWVAKLDEEVSELNNMYRDASVQDISCNQEI